MPKTFLVLEITDVTNVKKGVKKAGKTFKTLARGERSETQLYQNQRQEGFKTQG